MMYHPHHALTLCVRRQIDLVMLGDVCMKLEFGLMSVRSTSATTECRVSVQSAANAGFTSALSLSLRSQLKLISRILLGPPKPTSSGLHA